MGKFPSVFRWWPIPRQLFRSIWTSVMGLWVGIPFWGVWRFIGKCLLLLRRSGAWILLLWDKIKRAGRFGREAPMGFIDEVCNSILRELEWSPGPVEGYLVFPSSSEYPVLHASSISCQDLHDRCVQEKMSHPHQILQPVQGKRRIHGSYSFTLPLLMGSLDWDS